MLAAALVVAASAVLFVLAWRDFRSDADREAAVPVAQERQEGKGAEGRGSKPQGVREGSSSD